MEDRAEGGTERRSRSATFPEASGPVAALERGGGFLLSDSVRHQPGFKQGLISQNISQACYLTAFRSDCVREPGLSWGSWLLDISPASHQKKTCSGDLDHSFHWGMRQISISNTFPQSRARFDLWTERKSLKCLKIRAHVFRNGLIRFVSQYFIFYDELYTITTACLSQTGTLISHCCIPESDNKSRCLKYFQRPRWHTSVAHTRHDIDLWWLGIYDGDKICLFF